MEEISSSLDKVNKVIFFSAGFVLIYISYRFLSLKVLSCQILNWWVVSREEERHSSLLLIGADRMRFKELQEKHEMRADEKDTFEGGSLDSRLDIGGECQED